MDFRIENQRPLSVDSAVHIKGVAVQIRFLKSGVGRFGGTVSSVCHDAAEFLIFRKRRFPAVDLFQGVVRQVVVGIHCEKQFSLRQLQTVVDGAALAAVFLVAVADRKGIVFLLPPFKQRLCPVGGAVVHHQPFKVREALTL